MRKTFLLILLGAIAVTATAQMTRRPVFRPDWVFEAPRPSNGTYLYVVEHGEGNTKREALNQALGRIFQSTANRIGQAFSTDAVNRAVQSGTDFEVIARNMKVPINKVCEFPVQDTLTNSWTMYILCQVAKAGNITPEFEATDECTKHTRFDKALAKWKEQQEAKEKQQQQAILRKNGQALVASTFIPGMGQMLKKQNGSGAAFLVSEVALFGGGTACYFLGQEQLKTMKAAGTSYNNYKEAKDMKGTLDIAMYTCFGVGIAVHIANMVHAWYVKDKHLPVTVAFVPAVIPTNELSTPSFATGAGIQVTF